MPLISLVSVGDDLGLAYWPANLPTRVTGMRSPWMRTSDICKRILSLLAMGVDEHSASISAQSPPWRMNLFPCWASAISSRSFSISPEVTSGGSWASRSRAWESSERSG